MTAPTRQVFEISVRGVAVAAGRSGLSFGQIRRLEQEMKRRTASMGLAVQECRFEKARLKIVAVMPAHLVRQNVERALSAALHAIVKKEFPHVVLRGKRGKGIEDVGLPV